MRKVCCAGLAGRASCGGASTGLTAAVSAEGLAVGASSVAFGDSAEELETGWPGAVVGAASVAGMDFTCSGGADAGAGVTAGGLAAGAGGGAATGVAPIWARGSAAPAGGLTAVFFAGFGFLTAFVAGALVGDGVPVTAGVTSGGAASGGLAIAGCSAGADVTTGADGGASVVARVAGGSIQHARQRKIKARFMSTS